MAEAEPSAKQGVRRGGLARFAKRGCGCAALLLGALVALVVALPSFTGRRVAAIVEREFGESYAGSLELPRVSLAWTARQRVSGLRLLDPEGSSVGRASVELPSILDLGRAVAGLLRDEGAELGRFELDFDLALAFDAEGRSNLARALEARAQPPARGGERPREARVEGDPGELLERLGLELALRPSSLSWRDARLGPGAPTIALGGLRGSLALRPGGALELALRGEHDLGQAGTLELLAGVKGMRAASGQRGLGALDLELGIDGLAPAVILRRALGAERGDALADLLGPRLAFRAELREASGSGFDSLVAKLECAGLDADLRASLGAGQLGTPLGAPLLQAKLRAPAESLLCLVRAHLPEGAELGLPSGALEGELRITDVAVQHHNPEALATARATAALTLGALSWKQPDAPPGALLELERCSLGLELRPSTRPLLTLDAVLQRGGGRISGRAELESGWDQAVRAGRYADLRADLRLGAPELDTRLVDALARQDGLLVDVLGPRLALEFDAQSLSASGGRLTAHLSSTLGTFEARGTWRDGALVSSESGDALTLRAGLAPLLSERIVGPLLPLLVGLEKPAGAAPLALSVEDFRLPLSGELRGLSARLSLALGEVRYQLLPGLASLLPAEQALTRRSTTLAPLSMRIVNGVLGYEKLPLSIEGERYELSGTYELASKKLALDFDVPLRNLRGEVGKALDALRPYLAADLAVPLHLGGTTRRPELGLRGDFLEKAGKEALQRGMQKGLETEIQKGLRKLFGER